MKKTCSYCGIVDMDHICPYKAKRDRNKWKQIDKFYSSYRWTKLRKRILDEQPYCMRCWLKYGVINPKRLEAHHILARSKYPELELEEENIIMVCSQCNKELGDKSLLDFELLDKDREKFYLDNK